MKQVNITTNFFAKMTFIVSLIIWSAWFYYQLLPLWCVHVFHQYNFSFFRCFEACMRPENKWHVKGSLWSFDGPEYHMNSLYHNCSHRVECLVRNTESLVVFMARMNEPKCSYVCCESCNTEAGGSLGESSFRRFDYAGFLLHNAKPFTRSFQLRWHSSFQ